MKQEMVDAVIEAIVPERIDPEDRPGPLEGYATRTIRELTFRPIEPTTKDLVCYIDGGQAELLKMPGSSFHYLQIKAIIMAEDKLRKQHTLSCYLLVHEGKPTLFMDKGEEFPLPEEDETASEELPGLVRRVAELHLACTAAEDLSPKACICLDGTLQTKSRTEAAALERLQTIVKERQLNLYGFAKTCNLMTEKGIPLLQAIDLFSQEKTYACDCYYPEGQITISVAKLHEAGRVFRIDSFPNTSFHRLAGDARDATFPGYPYGLILVDRLGRVSERERAYLKTRFMTLAKGRWKGLIPAVESIDAHDVLDKLG